MFFIKYIYEANVNEGGKKFFDNVMYYYMYNTLKPSITKKNITYNINRSQDAMNKVK